MRGLIWTVGVLLILALSAAWGWFVVPVLASAGVGRLLLSMAGGFVIGWGGVGVLISATSALPRRRR